MFIGHFAVAFAAKRAAPELSLGTLFAAAQLADLVWPTLVLPGIESFEVRPGITAVTPLDFLHYPYSHSLVALAGWGLLLAIAWLAVRRGTPKAALLLVAVVLSHWLLDVVARRPDMPLTLGGDARLGLGLWNSIPATLAVEGGLFAVCVARLRRQRVRAAAHHCGSGVERAGDLAACRVGLLGGSASQRAAIRGQGVAKAAAREIVVCP